MIARLNYRQILEDIVDLESSIVWNLQHQGSSEELAQLTKLRRQCIQRLVNMGLFDLGDFDKWHYTDDGRVEGKLKV